MKIVINTPSGNIGNVVTDVLLQSKHEVVIISRNLEKVNHFVKRGATLIHGSIDDAVILDRAFQNADALFWLSPPAYHLPNYLDWVEAASQTAAKVAKKNHVKHAVVMSSAGAQYGKGAGPIGALLAVENSFNEAVPNVTILRAGFFMENFIHNLETIVKMGTIFSWHPSNKKIPMVATRDIGTKAAEILQDTNWKGFRIIGVHGPEDINQTEAADFISKGIELPVKYVEVTIDQLKKGMIGSGMPVHIAEMLCEMYAAIECGNAPVLEPRSNETTTNTSLLEFSKTVLKPLVEKVMKGQVTY